MRYFIIVAVTLIFFPFSGHADSSGYEEVIVKSNRIMKNIYNDIWRIRGNYDELSNFSLDNYSNTKELPIQYQSIKSIHIKGIQKREKFNIFKQNDFGGDKDVIYICFSDKNKAFGTLTQPFVGVYVDELCLYLLVYANTDNVYLKHDITNIIKRNAVVVEQTSY
ncbi:MAG: hypothetical protein WC412_02965 [Candidatus Omnitrophota bacterium]|jgi:muconolactone delta-isomerase